MAGEKLVEIMKTAALGAVENKSMADILFGEVTSEKPLKVKIDNRFELEESFLIVPRNLTDYTVTVMMDDRTEIDLIRNLGHSHSTPSGSSGSALDINVDHSHAYKGDKEYVIKNGLKAGEKVILLRAIGGQQYYILDKVVSK